MTNSETQKLSTSNSYNAFSSDFYDAAYFETGLMSGKSCYTYYHWMPELTFRLAMAIIEYTHLGRQESVLDWGCAKGFLVKALRYLFRDAYGCDWSEYAIQCAERDVVDYVRLSSKEQPIPFDRHFHLCICKDVLEHIPCSELDDILTLIRQKTDRLLVIVPLGNGDKFFIEEYEADKSHFIREDMDWWCDCVQKAQFKVVSRDYYVPGIKDAWHQVNPRGNAVLLCE